VGGGLSRCRRREISNTMKNMAKQEMRFEKGTGAGERRIGRKKRQRQQDVEGGQEWQGDRVKRKAQ
jgi:hypothetical protein